MKAVKKLLVAILLGIICLGATPFMTSAASAGASLSGPGTVRAGDTIKINLNVNGSGIFSVSGSVKYDPAVLTLSSATQSISWGVSFNNSSGTVRFVANDAAQSSPINGTKTLITMTFTVSSSLAEGSAVSLTAENLQASSGELINIGNAYYSKTIAPPLSSENKLASLHVSNATLSPAFNENTTRYSAGTVPFSTGKLNVSATPKDSAAKISISGTSLEVGSNTVTVTVTAPSGATRAYTITVTRQQDPNYVPESNNHVTSISIDGFVISPPFSANTRSYVVWLPYETTQITVAAAAESGKASIKIEGGSDLQVGENEIKITCTAEDGTAQTYLLTANRAAPFGGGTEEPDPDPTPDPDPAPDPENGDDNVIFYVLMPVLLVAGVGIGLVLSKVLKKKPKADPEKIEDQATETETAKETEEAKAGTIL